MIIYKTTNLINGKFYIGQDSNNNPAYIGSGILLNRAIIKYGIVKEVLEVCNSKEELNKKEIFWIESLKPVYNIAKGGSGGDTLSAHPNLELIKNKFKGRVSYFKGKKRPDMLGENNPAKRPEIREKISQAKLKNPTQMFGDSNPAKRLEVRDKISKNTSKSWENRTLIKCPYCNKESINASGMSRWHFNNCKYKA
jgi:group I intron endonuclease